MTRHPGYLAKPTPAGLGVDLAALDWERSGAGDGSIEVAFPLGPASEPAAWERGEWVLMRVAGDSAGRVLVFDRNEWACFLDGVRKGEFDDAASVLAGGASAPAAIGSAGRRNCGGGMRLAPVNPRAGNANYEVHYGNEGGVCREKDDLRCR